MKKQGRSSNYSAVIYLYKLTIYNLLILRWYNHSSIFFIFVYDLVNSIQWFKTMPVSLHLHCQYWFDLIFELKYSDRRCSHHNCWCNNEWWMSLLFYLWIFLPISPVQCEPKIFSYSDGWTMHQIHCGLQERTATTFPEIKTEIISSWVSFSELRGTKRWVMLCMVKYNLRDNTSIMTIIRPLSSLSCYCHVSQAWTRPPARAASPRWWPWRASSARWSTTGTAPQARRQWSTSVATGEETAGR